MFNKLGYAICFVVLCVSGVRAQYPNVPKDTQREAIEKMEATNRKSDAAWEQAQPTRGN